MAKKFDEDDTALGLEIVRALSEKNADLLVVNVGEYMRFHGLTASPKLANAIPFAKSNAET